MSIWLRIAGYPATEIAPHSPVTWETWADGGTGSITWEFALSPRSQHQALRNRALVEVMCGPVALATGIMTDPDRTTWQCTAYGLAADAKHFPALDGGGSNTRNVGTAITQAIAAGWKATNPMAVTGTASGDTTGNPITLAQLLDEYAMQLGQRWRVGGNRQLSLSADPTTPTWIASPDSAAFGTTNEDRATRLAGRYLDSTTGTFLTAGAGSGIPYDTTDALIERRAMTNAEAVTILTNALARDRSQTAWTNGVTLTHDQIQTMGGTPAFLPAVRAGQMMRSFGLSYGIQALALDAVIGKTRYTDGDDVIYVEPVNIAARSLADVIAAS